MNAMFKYNSNAKYSIIDLKGGYTNNNLLVLYVYLNEKDGLLKSNY